MQSSCFERMVGIVSSSFYDLVKVGECINSGLENRKIQDTSSSQINENESLNSSQEEEEVVINAVMEDVEYSRGALEIPYVPPSS